MVSSWPESTTKVQAGVYLGRVDEHPLVGAVDVDPLVTELAAAIGHHACRAAALAFAVALLAVPGREGQLTVGVHSGRDERQDHHHGRQGHREKLHKGVHADVVVREGLLEEVDVGELCEPRLFFFLYLCRGSPALSNTSARGANEGHFR